MSALQALYDAETAWEKARDVWMRTPITMLQAINPWNSVRRARDKPLNEARDAWIQAGKLYMKGEEDDLSPKSGMWFTTINPTCRKHIDQVDSSDTRECGALAVQEVTNLQTRKAVYLCGTHYPLDKS